MRRTNDHSAWEIVRSTEEGDRWIESQMEEFNRNELSFTGKQLEVPINYMIKVENKVVAGIKSCFYLEEILSIGVLFVDESFRHKGLGTVLLEKVESEAKERGAKLAHLYTFDFHAKDFYLKHGYEIFGILENCPKGHACYYMKKIV